MAKKLEEHLYRSAHTKDEYIDPASLKRRLHLIAKGVGIPKPGSGEDLEASSTVGSSRGSQAGSRPEGQDAPRGLSSQPAAIPLEAPSAPTNPTQQQQQASDDQISLQDLPSDPMAQDAKSEKKKVILLQQQRRLLLLRHAVSV